MSEFNGLANLANIGYRAVMAAIIEDIRAVRNELQQFDALQTDFAVRFHIAVLDANLRAAAEGRDDPIFREGLAPCVKRLAASISNPGRGCGPVRCMFCQRHISLNHAGIADDCSAAKDRGDADKATMMK